MTVARVERQRNPGPGSGQRRPRVSLALNPGYASAHPRIRAGTPA